MNPIAVKEKPHQITPFIISTYFRPFPIHFIHDLFLLKKAK